MTNKGLAWPFLLLFVGLKLAKVIDWSWWLVLMPLWIVLGLALLLGVLKCLEKPKTPLEKLIARIEKQRNQK
jgi:membrane protein DedA with SNARE-associated domain